MQLNKSYFSHFLFLSIFFALHMIQRLMFQLTAGVVIQVTEMSKGSYIDITPNLPVPEVQYRQKPKVYRSALEHSLTVQRTLSV